MAFPSIAQIVLTSRTSGATDDVINLPTTVAVAAGDLLVVITSADANATRTWTAGWTELKDTNYGGSASVGVAYKIAAGGETTVTCTKSVSERFTAIAFKILAANWHGTTPPEISAGATATSVSPDPDSVTASWGSADNLLVAIMAQDSNGGGAVTGWPTNYTGNQTQSDDITSAGRCAMATRELAASNDDPGVFTVASIPWWAGTLVIRPASTGSVGASAGSATCAAIGVMLALAVAVSAGVATVTSVGSSTAAAISASAGIASASGIGAGTAAAAGLSDGVAQASGIGEATSGSAASSAGIATTNGITTSTATAVGVGAGSAVGLAVGASTADGVGSSSGSASVSGTSESGAIESGAGASAGSSTGTGVGASTAAGNGASNGFGTAIGLGASTVASAGTSAGSTTTSAVSGDATFERVGTQIFTRLGLGGPLAALDVVVPAELAPTADVIVQVHVDVGIIQVRPDVGTIQVSPDPVTVEI